MERYPKSVYEGLLIPKEKDFYDFYLKFDSVKEITQSKEWEELYSYYYGFNKYELSINPQETIDDLNKYDYKRQQQEIIKCVNDFHYFCHKYVKIIHTLKGKINFITFNFQKRVIEDYTNHKYNILSKLRQGGLTTVSVIWGLWRCMFRTDQQLLVISKTDREAIGSGEIVKTAIENLPEWLKPQMGNNSYHEKHFDETGSKFRFYTPEAARSKAITWLLVDEAAFIKDMDKHWIAMAPVLATGGSCSVVSTVNGIGNWYEETYRSALNKENKFNIVEIDYWEHPLYNNKEWIEDQKAQLGTKGWQQEILRSFLGSGENYIDSKIINDLEDQTRNNTPARIKFEKWTNSSDSRYDWEKGALWIWKEPIEGHEYIVSCDTAEGVGDEGDNSCIEILDSTMLEQVAQFYSNTVPPHIFSQIVSELSYYYNTALVVVERNKGGAVINALEHDLNYENLYYNPNKSTECGVNITPKNRSIILESLQNKLMNGVIKINSPRFVNELKTFIFNNQKKRAEALKGRHDDSIMAISIALWIRDKQIRDLPIGTDMPDNNILNVFKKETFMEIKREIMNDDLENFIEQENDEDLLYYSNESEKINVPFNIKRKQDDLLKEFGW